MIFDWKASMNENININIAKIFRKSIEKKVKLNSCFLFGSRARNDYFEGSDMDILVVLDKLSKKNENYVSDCAWQISLKHGIVIVPVVYDQNEWNNSPERYSLLAMAVRQDGIII